MVLYSKFKPTNTSDILSTTDYQGQWVKCHSRVIENYSSPSTENPSRQGRRSTMTPAPPSGQKSFG